MSRSLLPRLASRCVRVTALSAPTSAQVRRLGFMAGQISVPDDFDRMGQEEIERMFGEETLGGGA